VISSWQVANTTICSLCWVSCRRSTVRFEHSGIRSGCAMVPPGRIQPPCFRGIRLEPQLT
jgi:hypothetical protein